MLYKFKVIDLALPDTIISGPNFYKSKSSGLIKLKVKDKRLDLD